MITTILIVLVAVVVLIVIIAVLALRYLRADDSDTFDDIPDEPRRTRRSAEPGRDQLASGPARRPRPAEPVTEVWTGNRPVRSSEGRSQGGYRDRDTGPRPVAAERTAAQPGGRREPAAARPARAARPAGPDALTSSWDSLSDVDYWAELAADKPQITPAAAGPAARPDSRADQGQPATRKRQLPARAVGATPARPAEPGQTGQTEQLDVRAAAAASARYGGELATPGPDVPSADPLRRRNGSRPATPQRPAAATQAQRSAAARPATAPRPVQPSRPSAPAPHASLPNGTGRTGPANDDPLTSPSFPAINTSDSRSYRGRRSADSQPGTSGQHARPGRQYIDYSSAPDRAASRADGYPAQPAAALPPAVQQPAQPSLPPAAATPAANPYGSYVSAPEPAYSEPAYQPGGYEPAGYPQTPAASLAAASHLGYTADQPAAANGTWYPAPAIEAGSGAAAAHPLGQPADGYLPAAGLRGAANGGTSHVQNGSASRGYAGIDYSNLSYDDPVYPGGQGALAGYGRHGQLAAPYDQQGYGGHDAGYGQDGYQGYPGYGAAGR